MASEGGHEARADSAGQHGVEGGDRRAADKHRPRGTCFLDLWHGDELLRGCPVPSHRDELLNVAHECGAGGWLAGARVVAAFDEVGVPLELEVGRPMSGGVGLRARTERSAVVVELARVVRVRVQPAGLCGIPRAEGGLVLADRSPWRRGRPSDVLDGALTDVVSSYEAAQILECSPDNIRRLAREGRLRAVIATRAGRLFSRHDVEALSTSVLLSKARKGSVKPMVGLEDRANSRPRHPGRLQRFSRVPKVSGQPGAVITGC